MHGSCFQVSSCQIQWHAPFAGLGPGGVPRKKGIRPSSREFQIDNWTWDVFVCHAGPDKPFALALDKRLPPDLRCFVDEESLLGGDHATACMENACKTAQIAVILLSGDFFIREDPRQELQWILENSKGGRTTVVPVFLGVTVKKCWKLARQYGQGLEEVCDFTGIRHMCEWRTLDGRAVTREDTMNKVVNHVRALTGV